MVCNPHRLPGKIGKCWTTMIFITLFYSALLSSCVTEPDNRPPVADLEVTPIEGFTTTYYVFDASGSTDPDDESRFLQIRWDWNGDSIWDTFWGTPKRKRHRFDNLGAFTVAMEIKDPWGASDVATVGVTVGNMSPVALIDVTPSSGEIATEFQFEASGCYDDEDDVSLLEVRWDWEDDGIWDTEWTTSKVEYHSYPSFNIWTARLEVRDTDGFTNSTTTEVLVHAEILWQLNAPESTVNSTPAIGDDGTIYIGSEDGLLYAVSPSGNLIWSFPTSGGINASPAIGSDGTIYFGSTDGNAYAVNPNGTLRWSYALESPISSSCAITPTGRVYYAPYDGSLWAFTNDGTREWTYESGGGNTWSSPSVASDGTIYYGGDESILHAVNPDSTLKWDFNTDSSSLGCSPAIGADGTIYVVDYNYLIAINSDGSEKWRILGGSSMAGMPSPVIGEDGTIYSPAGPWLRAVHPDGSIKWTYRETNAYAQTSFTVGNDGTLFVGCGTSYLYAFNQDGTVMWKIPGECKSSPSISNEGTLYVGIGWTLTAISTESFGLADSDWPKFRKDNKNRGSW